MTSAEGMSALAGSRAAPHAAAFAVVEMPFAEAAVDVDKPEDLALVEMIFARRGMA